MDRFYDLFFMSLIVIALLAVLCWPALIKVPMRWLYKAVIEIIRFFIPKNLGIKRLCLVISVLSVCCVLFVADKFVFTLCLAVFVLPFIVAKIVEYIVTGFNESKK